jgi:carbon monoxide dehydrogenase subunit G
MHFTGEFRVPGSADAVIRRFADVPRMARCMPGAVLEPQAEDGSWPGAMVVAFGPKKVNFKGRVTCDFDLDGKTGSLHGRGTADMRAARIGVKVAFVLLDDAAAAPPMTISPAPAASRSPMSSWPILPAARRRSSRRTCRHRPQKHRPNRCRYPPII